MSVADPKEVMMSTLQIDLLSAWRKVSAGASQLFEAVDRLPEECQCANGDDHFDQNCECCGGHERKAGHSRSDENCSAILSRLRADTALLAKDFSALAGPLELAAFATQSVELRRGVILTAVDLERVVQAFERLDHAVMGFRRNCTATDLKRIKSRCFELCFLCDRISSVLECTPLESAAE